MTVILPPDLRAIVPDGWQTTAAWQHLVSYEARAMGKAVASMLNAERVALPLHDALVVPVSSAGVAREAVERAFLAEAGVMPRVKVEIFG